MRLLIIGATGLVGEQIYRVARSSGFEAHGTYNTHQKEGLLPLNITNRKAVSELIGKIRPDVTILASALTNVDYCETHNKEAWDINVEGTRNVAEACKSAKSKLIYISTDYVFDGKKGPYSEEAVPNPINYYGLTKLEGEKITETLQDHVIVRSTWIFDFSSDTKNFVYRLINTLKENREIRVPNDQVSNPTFATNMAKSLLALVKKGFSGKVNISSSSRLSRYEFALKIAEKFSLNKSLIKAVSSEELGQVAKRPKNAGFKLTKIEKEISRMENIDEILSKRMYDIVV